MQAVDWSRRRLVAAATAIVVATTAPVLAQVQVRETVKPVEIIQIYGRDTLEVGEAETYRVRVNTPYLTAYKWRVSDGTEVPGNPIVYRFDEPGRYTIEAIASNPKGMSRDTIEVVVLGERPRRPAPVAEAKPAVATPNETSKGEAAATKTVAPPVSEVATKATRTKPVPKGSDSSGLQEGAQGNYTWVIATFFMRQEADALANSFRSVGYRSFVIIDSGGKGSTVFRVALGRFDSEDQAMQAKQEVRSHGVRNPLLHEVNGV
ncbi:MAG TPA: SPOR domain-containing protein [Rhodothermales bacterium]|nr:SPOR domain-containing protein [Rhodothermales bacterium]